jgi:hypothetical protein
MLIAFAANVPAQAGWLCGDGGRKPANCGCQVKWVCCPTYEKEKIEKSGFEVESEHICVPKVKFPWQKCCTPRCAKVICVHRLKKETKECGEKCVIKWEAKQVCVRCCKPTSGHNCGPNHGCGPSACAAPSEYHAPVTIEPTPTALVPPAPLN